MNNSKENKVTNPSRTPTQTYIDNYFAYKRRWPIRLAICVIAGIVFSIVVWLGGLFLIASYNQFYYFLNM